MKSGIFESDGVEYPDADASDPVALGWMQGSPPPAAKQIRFQDDQFLEFPQIRWSLSHMRHLAHQRRAERSRCCASGPWAVDRCARLRGFAGPQDHLGAIAAAHLYGWH